MIDIPIDTPGHPRTADFAKVLHLSALPFLMLLGLLGCAPTGSDADIMLRGDEAFARGELPEALAEYRLALQGERTGPMLARAAHAYTATGSITEAIENYREAVALDPGLADLAATDLLKFARRAIQTGDGLQASEAVAAAMVLRPGVSSDGIALPLAHHLVQTGRYARALPFFEQAALETDNSPQVLYDMALAYDEAGNCASALALFERAWRRISVAERADADWRTGNCSMRLGAEALEEGELDAALAYYETTIQIGEPRGQVPEAWFQQGEILIQKGECTEARGAFEQVLVVDPTPELRARAQDRIEALRFERNSFGSC